MPTATRQHASDELRPGTSVKAASSVPPSSFHTTVIPAAILVLAYLAPYSAMVSFTLRSNSQARLLPVGLAFFLGAFLGGALFPGLLSWAERTGSPLRRAALAVWLVAALAMVMPGMEQYIFNEPLRIVANLFLGMMIAPSYQIYFSRFPAAWRGTWFGVSLGAGLLCWFVMVHMAQIEPRGDGTFHPFLGTVYYVHTTIIAVFAILCVYALLLRPVTATRVSAYFTPSPASKSGTKQLRTLTFIGFIAFLLSGVLQAKLTPTLPAAPMSSEAVLPALFAAIGVIAAGWFLDRRPELVLRCVIPVCCWLFILAPALVVFGDSHALHGLIKTMAAVAQLILFMICTVALAGLAPDLRQSVFYTCCVYSARIATVFGYMAWKRVFASDPGMAILAAAAMAFLISLLIRRIDFHRVEENDSGTESQAGLNEEPAPSINPENNTRTDDTLEAFLDSVGLTPRERETAALLLDGQSGAEISDTLAISERTVKKHAGNVYRKFGIGSRRELQRLFTETLSAASGDAN